MNVLLTPWRRWGRAAATATVAASLAFVPVAPAHAQAGCATVDHAASTWSTTPSSGGFVLTITLANACSDPISGWTLALTLPPGHAFTHGWSADWSASGDRVTATHLPWNMLIDPGESISIGFTGSWSGSYRDPLSCAINGGPCDGGTGGNEPPEVTLTSPEAGFQDPITCPVTLAADASDPEGAIDRVEFYINNVLVGTDVEAPYEIVHSGPGVPRVIGNNTAFARVFDAGSPALSADSPSVGFVMLIPPPGTPGGDCRSGVPPIPPQVFLTSPAAGETIVSPCGVTLAADALAFHAGIDRVEFFVNNVLVGADATAPYEVDASAAAAGVVTGTNVARARAFDDRSPPLSSFSAPVTFAVLPPPPALMIIACTPVLEVPAGGSTVVELHPSAPVSIPVNLTVAGGAGVTASPMSFTLDRSGQEVTVSAPPGSAGATATITASSQGFIPATISVRVTGG